MSPKKKLTKLIIIFAGKKKTPKEGTTFQPQK